MLTQNWRINKVYCGLARLFITETGLEFPTEISAEALAAIDRAETAVNAINSRVDADKKTFTREAIALLFHSATRAGLSVHLGDDCMFIIERRHTAYKIKVELFQLDTAQDQSCACLQVYNEESNTLLIEACYWQPNDGTPMLTASLYLHPRVHHLALVENIRLGLQNVDKEYGGYAIQNLFDWWDREHGD